MDREEDFQNALASLSSSGAKLGGVGACLPVEGGSAPQEGEQAPLSLPVLKLCGRDPERGRKIFF